MHDPSWLDWPFFDDKHRHLREALLGWCADYDFPHSDDVDADCRQLVRDMGRAGWFRNCVPAAWGGLNDSLDVRSIALC